MHESAHLERFHVASLTPVEQARFEKLFDMPSGYVLGFSNTTFGQFIALSTERDIFDEKHNWGSGSKANRLRAFLSIEPAGLVGKLLLDLLEHWRDLYPADREDADAATETLYGQCLAVAHRLSKSGSLLSVPSAETYGSESIRQVMDLIREHVSKNRPEAGLDRLHTFLVHYLRQLCDQRSVGYTKDTPLNSLFGSYLKALEGADLVETEMTRRILKSSISILEAFNAVRNDHSLAHPNELLSRREATLIFNSIVGIFRFLSSVEVRPSAVAGTSTAENDWQDVAWMDADDRTGSTV